MKTSGELATSTGSVDSVRFSDLVPPTFRRICPPVHVDDCEYAIVNHMDVKDIEYIWIESAFACENDGYDDVDDMNKGCSIDNDRMLKSNMNSYNSVDSTAAMVELLKSAMVGPLPTADSNKLIEALKADDSIVRLVEMSPDKLPKLVEDNPMIAVELLFLLIPTKEISAYFESLVNMELSVHGMEVVNRLTTMVEVPEEFLNFYVLHCIRSCEEIKNSPFTQNRLVRMVCVFLSSLIRNRLINVKDLYIELQAFSVHFNAVKEAAALFQTVQMVVRDNNIVDETNIG